MLEIGGILLTEEQIQEKVKELAKQDALKNFCFTS